MSLLRALSSRRKSLHRSKQHFSDEETFQLALLYFNRRWEKHVRPDKKQSREEDQNIYMERLVCRTAGRNCDVCRMALNAGEKYYVNKRSDGDLKCRLCMEYKLRKEVGNDKERLDNELRWLNYIEPSQGQNSQVVFLKH